MTTRTPATTKGVKIWGLSTVLFFPFLPAYLPFALLTLLTTYFSCDRPKHWSSNHLYKHCIVRHNETSIVSTSLNILYRLCLLSACVFVSIVLQRITREWYIIETAH